MEIRCADNVTPLYPQKLALTSPTGGGRSVGIVRSRTKAKEFFFNNWINYSLEIASIYSFEDKETVLFYPILPTSGGALLFCKISFCSLRWEQRAYEEHWWKVTDGVNRSTRGGHPNATLSTIINFTKNNLGLNPALRGVLSGLHLNIHFVTRSKHTPSRIQKTNLLLLYRKHTLLRSIANT